MCLAAPGPLLIPEAPAAREVYIPQSPPEWFDPMDAGESWDGDY